MLSFTVSETVCRDALGRCLNFSRVFKKITFNAFFFIPVSLRVFPNGEGVFSTSLSSE